MENIRLTDNMLERVAGGDTPGPKFALTDFVYIITKNRMPGMIVDFGTEEETYIVAYGSHIDSGREEGRRMFRGDELEPRTEFVMLSDDALSGIYGGVNFTTHDENVHAAESSFRDADMAKEMTDR